MQRHRGPGRWQLIAVIGAITLTVAACSSSPAGDPPDESTRAARDAALASARVWAPPPVPVAEANLRDNPRDGPELSPDSSVECRFILREVGGTTPKFYCELPTGETLKVKYGSGNPELPAEVAASRLLTALGFYADHMFVVRSVRCAGCPRYPFQALRCLERTGLRIACFGGPLDDDRIVVFPTAVVERRLEGRVIEAVEDQGWGWYELARVAPAHGGSARAEVDALRLMAVFLAHWDNKPANQRLVCPPGGDLPDGGCARPIAIVQDLGATFGPLKLDLQNWRQGRIWKDPVTCTVSMEHLPWGGGTFPEGRISEAGRQLLLGLLERLSDAQLRDLFAGARVVEHGQFAAEAASARAWAEAFKDRVRQIREGGPC